MKLTIFILILTLLIFDESNAFRPKKFTLDCELKDGMFNSSFTNFDKKDIKKFKNKNLSFQVDTISNTITSNSNDLFILHGISESEDLLDYEGLIKKKWGKKSWETFKKYKDMYELDIFWVSELVIEEEPLTKYKYEGAICLLCSNAKELLEIKIVEYGRFSALPKLKEKIANIEKAEIAKNLKNPYTLIPACKWKPLSD